VGKNQEERERKKTLQPCEKEEKES
jgi:hypothetical protein